MAIPQDPGRVNLMAIGPITVKQIYTCQAPTDRPVSNQVNHVGGADVASRRSMRLIASWIALEKA